MIPQGPQEWKLTLHHQRPLKTFLLHLEDGWALFTPGTAFMNPTECSLCPHLQFLPPALLEVTRSKVRTTVKCKEQEGSFSVSVSFARSFSCLNQLGNNSPVLSLPMLLLRTQASFCFLLPVDCSAWCCVNHNHVSSLVLCLEAPQPSPITKHYYSSLIIYLWLLP